MTSYSEKAILEWADADEDWTDMLSGEMIRTSSCVEHMCMVYQISDRLWNAREMLRNIAAMCRDCNQGGG